LDFAWSEEQRQFRQEVIRFAKEELNDNVIERDLNEEFSWDGWKKCAQFGIHGLPIPQEYGGGGADVLTTVCGLEALGFGCRDNGLIFSINAHMWSSEIPLLSFGTEAQKKKYLPKLVSGEFVGVHAITEPMSGSDAYSMRARAERKSDCYVINGSKTFITNAPVADMVIVFANLDPSKSAAGVSAFIVDKGTPGFSISRKLHKMGLRTSPMAELALVDVEVPVENLLGREGGGPAIFTASMEWERICIMAQRAKPEDQEHDAEKGIADLRGCKQKQKLERNMAADLKDSQVVILEPVVDVCFGQEQKNANQTDAGQEIGSGYGDGNRSGVAVNQQY